MLARGILRFGIVAKASMKKQACGTDHPRTDGIQKRPTTSSDRLFWGIPRGQLKQVDCYSPSILTNINPVSGSVFDVQD